MATTKYLVFTNFDVNTSAKSSYYVTVLPVLGDSRRERPPDVYGHLINVPTHLNIKLPAIGGHLLKEDNLGL